MLAPSSCVVRKSTPRNRHRAGKRYPNHLRSSASNRGRVNGAIQIDRFTARAAGIEFLDVFVEQQFVQGLLASCGFMRCI